MKKFLIPFFVLFFLYSKSSYSNSLLDYYYGVIDFFKGQVSLSCQTNSIPTIKWTGFDASKKYNLVLNINRGGSIIRFEEIIKDKIHVNNLLKEGLNYTFNIRMITENEFKIIYQNNIYDIETMIKINRVTGVLESSSIDRSKFWIIGKCKRGQLYKNKKKF